MKTFSEYEEIALQTPACPDGQSVEFATIGLIVEAGKISKTMGSLSGRTAGMSDLEQREVAKRLADVLWYLTLICRDSGTTLESVAKISCVQLKERNLSI